MAKYNEKYFGKNSEVCAVENMLSAGEQIILREKPKRNAYILAQVFKMMPFALLWIVFDGAFIGLMIGFELFKSMPAPLIVFLIVFFAFHLLPVWIWISNIVTAGRRQKNIEYIIHDTILKINNNPDFSSRTSQGPLCRLSLQCRLLPAALPVHLRRRMQMPRKVLPLH